MSDPQPAPSPPDGAQRLKLTRLHEWERLEYGMFITFGLGTFGTSFPKTPQPSILYAPDHLDVDQWVRVARDAGMTYAVLTTKHVTGHCLWPSAHTDYHVGTSGNATDVVEAFVTACQKYGITPGLYYCSWDNYHTFGSFPPTHLGIAWANADGREVWNRAFTTAEYRAFQMAQIEELLTRYGPVGEVWIDIPHLLTQDGRRKQYAQIASLCPDALIMMNSGWQNGATMDLDFVWPTDLMAIESTMPPTLGYNPWFTLELGHDDRSDYYVPGEVCECIGQGYAWFRNDYGALRSDAELLAMRLICRERHTNLLLNTPPDQHGVIPQETVAALMRLRLNIDKLGL